MTPFIKLEHIDKQFPGVRALTDVNIEFYPGEVHVLAGENGAGKSTMIKIILSAYKPSAGKIYLEGKEVHIANPLEASKLGIEACLLYTSARPASRGDPARRRRRRRTARDHPFPAR